MSIMDLRLPFGYEFDHPAQDTGLDGFLAGKYLREDVRQRLVAVGWIADPVRFSNFFP